MKSFVQTTIAKLTDSEKVGIMIALGFLAIGLLIAVFLALIKHRESATLIALLLVPLLAYGIAAGKIRELTAPGGWSAKFREVAQAKVDPSPVTDCVEDFQSVAKAGADALRIAGQRLERGKPIALTMQLKHGHYNPTELNAYLRSLKVADPEMTVLFLDEHRRFVAMIEGGTLIDLLMVPEQSDKLFQALGEGNRDELLNLPGVQSQTMAKQHTNAEALQLMRRAGAKTMVVVNDAHQAVGIVKRDHIIARLVAGLAAGAPQERPTG